MAERYWNPSPNNFWFRPVSDLYPDIRNCVRPGDVILFASGSPYIQHTQRIRDSRLSGEDESQSWVWTHAAIYIDADHLLCEATFPAGVGLGNLEDRLLKGQTFQVFRHPNLDAERGQLVARAAVRFRGDRYAWEQCLNFALFGKLTGAEQQSDRHVCSTLCERALIAAGIALKKKRGESVTPSFLSRVLTPVEVASLPVNR